MMLNDALAILADAYIPALAVIIIYQLADAAKHRKHRFLSSSATYLVLATMYIYVLRFLDTHYLWWPQWQLDYSTHTALAWVFVIQLCGTSERQRFFATSSLCFYGALMSHMGYHNLNDMITTSIAVVPILLLKQFTFKYLIKWPPGSKAGISNSH